MEDQDLIDRLREFYSDRDTTGFNVLDFISAFGSPLQAILYSRFFWPQFIEIDNMIFLKETIEDDDDRKRLKEALERYGMNKQKTEQSFNLVEIPSGIFNHGIDEILEEDDRDLAEKLAAMWRCRLGLLYPGRRFTVEVLEPEETGSEVGVIFYQT